MRVELIDSLVNTDRPAGKLARLSPPVPDLHDITGDDPVARHVPWRDQEIVAPPADRHAAVRRNHHALPTRTKQHSGDIPADGSFLRRVVDAVHFWQVTGNARLECRPLGVGLADRLAEDTGINQGSCREFKGLEAHEGVFEIRAADHRAVVFHQNAVVPVAKVPGDTLSQRLGAGTGVGRVSDGSTDCFRPRDSIQIRRLPDDTEGNQRRRMSVHNRIQVRARIVDCPVER